MSIPEIDALISGTLANWTALRAAALADPRVLAGILALCEAMARRPGAELGERYRAWRAYSDSVIATDVGLDVLREAWKDAAEA